jgi:hypothetical protein|nr:hypothetical protein [Kofleriaceae bacterium]
MRSAAAAAVATLLAAAGPVAADTVVYTGYEQPGTAGPVAGAVASDPDVASAIGPTDILDIVTGQLVSRDPYQQRPPLATSTEQFWTESGISGTPNAYEHRALYDASSGRFFVTADEHVAGANRRYLAVSATSGANGGWQAVALPVDGVVTNTRVAVDSNGVYITGDAADGTTHVVVIPLADALASPPSLAHLATFVAPDPGVIPAIDLASVSKLPTDPEYLAARGIGTSGDTTLRTYYIAWNGTGGAPLLEQNLATDLEAVFPPPPPTALDGGGTLVSTGGSELRSLIANGSVLTGLAATQVNGHAGAFWFQYDPSQPIPTRQTIAPDPGCDLLLPTLGADSIGDLGIVGVETQGGTPGMRVVATGSSIYAGAPTLTGLQTIATSTASYTCNPDGGVSSFGRYASIGADPSSGGLFADVPFSSDGSPCAFQTLLFDFGVQMVSYADDFPVDYPDGGYPDDPIGGDENGNDGGCGCHTAAPRDGAAPLLLVGLGLVIQRARARARRRADRSR